jgi:hypothetical protein
MNIRISTDVATGAFFCILGAGAIYIGAGYPMGSAARMGPGYFPFLVSVGLIMIGLFLLGRSIVTESTTIGQIALRPLLTVVASTLAFGLLIEDWGFPLAGLVLVGGVCFARPGLRPIEIILLVVGLVGFCILLFAYLLGLNLPHTHL